MIYHAYVLNTENGWLGNHNTQHVLYQLTMVFTQASRGEVPVGLVGVQSQAGRHTLTLSSRED